jgi:hypothetical protein
MTTVSKLTLGLACCLLALTISAQNTFPVSGAAGIGTVTPAAALDIFTSDTLEGNALQINPYFNAAGQATGEMRFLETTFSGADYIAFKAPLSLLAPVTFTLPGNSGLSGQFLTTDGFGNLSWTTPAKGASKKLSNLQGPTAINQSLLPNADNTLDLGSALMSWNNVYADGRGYFGTMAIGTSTLDAELTVSGTDEVITLEGTNPYIQFENGGLDKGYLRATGDDFLLSTNVLNTTGKLTFATKSTERMYIHPDGEITINTASPYVGYKLGVNGDVHISSQLTIGTTTADASAQVTLSGDDDVMVIDGTAPYITMKDAGSEVGFLQASGNDLKIGTFTLNDNGRLIFRTNGFDRGMVDENGNFLIGNPNSVTPATGFKLSVDGKVMCEELRVEVSPWADYVFDEDYKLITFAELEAFIEANKHLPGIPSAAVIESEGLEVGVMQAKMMEKIEELTLMVIQLNARIAELESVNK